ncbi:MAG: putative DNA binding domain-containing protein [Bacteroidales bacterium]|nr:putative DNA binding domain-containing protein [Bacteroidales bacterium]
MEKHQYLLFKRIYQGENETLDFKFSIADGPKIARTISAFANTQGGSILVGVKDNGKIGGIRSEEDIYYAQHIAEHFCNPPVPIETILYELEKKEILELIIPPLADVQLTRAPNEEGQYVAYLRYRSSNHVAGPIYERIWEKSRSSYINNITLLPSHLELLNFFEKKAQAFFLEEILESVSFSRSATIKILESLILSGFVEFYLTDEGMKYKRTTLQNDKKL